MMRNLPVPVEEEEIEAMFEFADKDKDGKINYRQGKNSRPKNKSNLNAIHSNLSVTHSLMIYNFSLDCPFSQSEKLILIRLIFSEVPNACIIN